jgi:hypothetical protein
MILNELYQPSLDESSGYSLAGSFTSDLTASKVWLLTELSKIAPQLSTMYVLGSWYSNLALYNTLQPMIGVDKIINVEVDPERLTQGRRMLDHVGADNVEHMLRDANKLDYRQVGNGGAVVNASMNDITGTSWFEKIPTGTTVVMQARDNVEHEQYQSTQDILDRFPLSQVLYRGSMKLEDPETPYTRYMVIGIK